MRKLIVLSCLVTVTTALVACGGKKNSPTSPTPVTPAAPKLTAPAPDTPADDAQLDTLRPTLIVRNATSDQPSGTRTYEFQVSDHQDFSLTAFSFNATFAAVISKTGVPEDPSGKTSFIPEQELQPTTLFYWRARVVQGTTTSDWSVVSRFKSKLVGYNRPGELYDPLIFGETVGQRIGSTTFIAGKGIKLNDKLSYVRYLLPQTITNGEFSMEVEGLAANGPGDKAKVFGMQEGQGDFITNRYRVDVQYRGVTGVPPNAIQWRAMFGDDNHRIEPDTATRMASVFLLNPATTYYWKAVWSNGFRLQVFEGSAATATAPFYNQGLSISAVYNPSPHYAYLGAPVGRSGSEAATIPGTIYRNVWIGSHPRPASLGSALDLGR